MRRPLTDLVMRGWTVGNPYPWQKLASGRGVVRYNDLNGVRDGQTFDADEVRQLHTWLGKVVEDLDNGV